MVAWTRRHPSFVVLAFSCVLSACAAPFTWSRGWDRGRDVDLELPAGIHARWSTDAPRRVERWGEASNTRRVALFVGGELPERVEARYPRRDGVKWLTVRGRDQFIARPDDWETRYDLVAVVQYRILPSVYWEVPKVPELVIVPTYGTTETRYREVGNPDAVEIRRSYTVRDGERPLRVDVPTDAGMEDLVEKAVDEIRTAVWLLGGHAAIVDGREFLRFGDVVDTTAWGSRIPAPAPDPSDTPSMLMQRHHLIGARSLQRYGVNRWLHVFVLRCAGPRAGATPLCED